MFVGWEVDFSVFQQLTRSGITTILVTLQLLCCKSHVCVKLIAGTV